MDNTVQEIQSLMDQYQQIAGHNPNYIVMDNACYLQLHIDGYIQRHNNQDYILGLLIVRITDCKQIQVNYYDILDNLV